MKLLESSKRFLNQYRWWALASLGAVAAALPSLIATNVGLMKTSLQYGKFHEILFFTEQLIEGFGWLPLVVGLCLIVASVVMQIQEYFKAKSGRTDRNLK